MRNVIVLSGCPREEGFRSAEILRPGMLVEVDASGGNGVVSHITNGGPVAPLMFVRENHEDNGKGITDAIADGDHCTVVYPQNGDVINAYTTDTIDVGDKVCSDGAGGVRLATSGAAVIGAAKSATQWLVGDNSHAFVEITIGAYQAE